MSLRGIRVKQVRSRKHETFSPPIISRFAMKSRQMITRLKGDLYESEN